MKTFTIFEIKTSIKDFSSLFVVGGNLDLLENNIWSDNGTWIFSSNDLKIDSWWRHEIYFYIGDKSISHTVEIKNYVGKYCISIEYNSEGELVVM